MPKQLDLYRQRYIQAVRTVMAEQDIFTLKEMAALLDSSDKTLSAIMQGNQYPTVQHAIDLCVKYDFSANWLLLGKGQKLIAEQATLDKILNRIQKL